LIIPTSFKLLSMLVRISSIILYLSHSYFNNSFYWQLVILAVASAGVLFFSMKLLSLKQFDRSKIRKYISIQSFLRYSLVPLMLLPIIDVIPTLILIFLPILWYLVFTPLTGVKLLQPRM